MPWFAALTVITCVYAFSPNFRIGSGGEEAFNRTPYAGDFLQEWIGGYVVLQGKGDRLYDLDYVVALQHDSELVGFSFDGDRYFPIVYPPAWYALVSPLSLVPMKWAATIWAVLMVASLFAAVRLLQIALPPSRLMNWLPLLAAIYPPVIESLGSSQKGTLWLLLLVASFVLLKQNRPMWAGCVFGLTAIKPPLAVVLLFVMVLQRNWRFVAGASFTMLLLVLTSLLVSPRSCYGFLQVVLGAGDYVATNGYDLSKSHCLYGFFCQLLGDHGLAAKVATGLAALGVMALIVARFHRRRPIASDKLPTDFAIIALATILLSPHLLTYDLTLLMLPMTVFASCRGSQLLEGRGRTLAAMLFAMPSLSVALAATWGLQISVIIMLWCLISFAAGPSRKTSFSTRPVPLPS